MTRDLTVERLRELLIYDPMTGLFINKISRGAAKAGKFSGGPGLHGYQLIAVDGNRYLAHRLAWLYTHGGWPKGEIDHINGIRDDNRLSNIRDVTKTINCQNLGAAKSHNQLGVLGVRKMRDKFQARIVVDGKTSCLGTFISLDGARNAYSSAKRRLHAGCTERS